jgi:seryl-tRNA synthetase
MHDIRFIREHPDVFDRALNRRLLSGQEKHEFSSLNILSIDSHHRAIIRTLESWQARRNAASKAIGEAKAKRDESKVQELLTEVADCKSSISQLEGEEKEARERLEKLLEQIPNLPLDDVPGGEDSSSNVEHHRFGAKREYAFAPKQHFELGEALGQMDFELAARLSGARFVVLQKGLARLERALGQFMLDMHTGEHGYTEVAPPLLVRDEVMFGTAQLPKFADDQFKTALIRDKKPRQEFETRILPQTTVTVEQLLTGPAKVIFADETGMVRVTTGSTASDVSLFVNTAIANTAPTILRAGLDDPELNERLWLIPTAEVSLTNLVRDAISDESKFPMRLTACTPCFRQEAGAAGKDTRGMIRQHQFTKVELVSITTPEQSRDEHERMLACAEEVLRRLDLHYRVVTLSTGDMGFAAQKTYDIEVWLPGQNMYREISSCSVCGDFQARRMNARYRGKDRNVRHVHTLNGSGVAVGRALIAVMETYQQADGSIAVPDVLQAYMGGMKKIERQ